MLQLDDVRVDVMCRLYDKYRRGPRDSAYLDVLDTALALTLGEKRAAENPDLLCRNVLRDARRSIRRSESRDRELASRRPLADARRRRVCRQAEDGSPGAEMVSHGTPEAHAIANETLQHLWNFARTLGRHGPGCLRDLIAGETAARSSQLTRVSVATVERARKALRDEAKMRLRGAL